ncbi:hypothetical protein AN1V17_11460 [Vallitalea sediminicola]
MKERLKQLRKELELNQENFGKKVSLSRTAVANMEIGHRTVTNRTIQLICSTFNVNEEWLRTGNGEMFNITEDLIELFGYMLNDMTEIEKDFMIKYLKLPSQERQMVVKYLKKLTCD